MVNLTTAQLQTIKAWVIANNGGAFDESAKTALNAFTAAFYVWRDLPMEDVLNTITFANMTPVDAVPTSPSLAVELWGSRSLACQGKQFNLQNLTIGRATAPMKRTNYRAALQDCLTNIPAGASGTLIAANWVGVRDGAKFLARVGESILATGTGTQASPADLASNGEGEVTLQNVVDAANS